MNLVIGTCKWNEQFWMEIVPFDSMQNVLFSNWNFPSKIMFESSLKWINHWLWMRTMKLEQMDYEFIMNQESMD